MKFKGILGVIGRVLKGAGDAATGGVVSAISSNKASKDGGEGKIDYPKIVGYIVVLTVVGGVVFGSMDVEKAKELIKMIIRFGFFA